jgi:cell division protein FtsW (lipid II flippase)
MITLATFRFVGRHAINLLSGIYLAAALAHIIGRLMPSAQIWTFIFLAVLWILTSLAVIIRELHGGRESLAELGIGALPPVIVGSAVVLFIARVVAHYEPTPGFSIIIAEWGLIFWVGGYLVMMRDAYHKKQLEEDLAKKPPESSNQSLEPTAGRHDAQL